MIAHDLGYTYVDEVDFGIHNYVGLILQLGQRENIVIQAPGICHMLHEIFMPDTAVVFMMRPVLEIIASQRRINWLPKHEKMELAKYNVEGGDISTIKYFEWLHTQKPRMIVDKYEVEYHSLKDHPLWVDKEERGDFAWNQTTKSGPQA